MSDGELTAWLEQNGEIPREATQANELRVWILAQKTSWWGKPIDATIFWEGKVRWLDSENASAAYRRGRIFPPVPPEVQRPLQYPDDGRLMGQSSVDSAPVRYVISSSENAFWNGFSRSHPQPPERIKQEQERIGERILVARHRFLHEGNPDLTSATQLAQMDERAKVRAKGAGYPAESLSDEALLWAYVMKQRERYETNVKPFQGSLMGSNSAAKMFRQFPVDLSLLTEPLTAEQLRAANVWKLSYLKRLRLEKTGEPYINAYLRAWKLTEAEVFGASSR